MMNGGMKKITFFKNMYVKYDNDITNNILKELVVTYEGKNPLGQSFRINVHQKCNKY